MRRVANHPAKSQLGKGGRGRFYPLFFLLASFILLLLILERIPLQGVSQPIKPAVVDGAIDSLLVQLGVDKEKVASFWGGPGIKKEKIRISDVYSLFFFHQSLQHLLQSTGARIIGAVELKGGKCLSLRVGFGRKVTHILQVERDPQVPAGQAELAIVLQDFSKGRHILLRKVLESDLPITLSFLPGTKLENLNQVVKSEKELLILLPLQSSPFPGMGKWEIGEAMAPQQLRRRVERVLNYFPPTKGIDLSFAPEISRKLLSEVLSKLEGKYLLVNHKIRNGSRKEVVFSEDFIDKRGRRGYILDKLKRVARLAWMEGKAVGVGRLSAQTWKIIEEERPKLERKGIKFVLLSKLAGADH